MEEAWSSRRENHCLSQVSEMTWENGSQGGGTIPVQEGHYLVGGRWVKQTRAALLGKSWIRGSPQGLGARKRVMPSYHYLCWESQVTWRVSVGAFFLCFPPGCLVTALKRWAQVDGLEMVTSGCANTSQEQWGVPTLHILNPQSGTSTHLPVLRNRQLGCPQHPTCCWEANIYIQSWSQLGFPLVKQ